MSKKQITFALAGNPNCGKTTIFNALTGARQKVGNWGGVTVEKKEGIFSRDNTEFHLVDLPGTYSLSAYSIEERIARDYILTGEAEVTCVIIDASNLERNLYLVTQLLEMQTRMVLVFNMMDEVEAKGTVIDFKKISKLFGVPVIPAVANRCRGMNEILDAVEQVAAKENKVKHVPIRYPREIESALKDISSELDSIERGLHQYPRAWLALKLLENDKNIREMLKGQTELLKKVDENRKNINQLFKDDAEMIITDHRYGFINGALKEVVSQSKKKKADTTDKVDRILIHRVLGIPILFFMLWFMFESTFTLGAYPMDWIGTAMGWISSFFTSIMEPGLFRSLIVDGIIAGVGGVAIFLPNILILFLFIALMEDTGYMARAAFVMDRIMHSVGLHGKSFIPLLMGFGCNVPAIMGTRVLESKRDRILTILINPFMSCSARLPVYVLFAGAFFTAHAGSVIFGLYILGVLIAVFSGMLFSRTLLKGQGEPFVMELPPYRLPTMRSLVIHMWERAVIFLKKWVA